MASQLLGIKTRFTNDLGSPLVGGQVYTYFAGTSTNQDTYSNAALTVPNTNPVILDDTGSADIFLKGAYRIRVFDKSGRFIEEQDNVTQAASQGDATELSNKVTTLESGLSAANTEINKVKLDTGITATAKNGTLPITQSEKNAQTISMVEYGATGDGTTDDTAAFELLEANVTGREIDLQGKTYKVDQVPTTNTYKNGYFNIAGIIHPSEFKEQELKFKKHCMQFITGNRYAGSLEPLIFGGSDNVFQGICIIPQATGNPKLYVTQRAYRDDATDQGNWLARETYRIVEYEFKEDGSDVAVTQFSDTLSIGHGSALSYTKDADGQVWFYSGYPSDSDADKNRSDKGFSRIKWRGAATNESDVTYYQMFDYPEVANGVFSYLNRAAVAVSTNGKYISFKADNTLTKEFKLLIYDLQSVLDSSNPKLVKPITEFAIKGGLHSVSQGFAIHDDKVILYSDVASSRSAVEILDFNGNTLSKFDFDTFRSYYSIDDLSGAQGVLTTTEGEGISIYANDIYVGYRDYWSIIETVVSYNGKFYAPRRDNTGIEPTNIDYWQEISSQYATGAVVWSNSTAYTVNSDARRLVNKRIYKLSSVQENSALAIGSTNLYIPESSISYGVNGGGNILYSNSGESSIVEYANGWLTRQVGFFGGTRLNSGYGEATIQLNAEGTQNWLIASRYGTNVFGAYSSGSNTVIATRNGQSLYLGTYTEDINNGDIGAHTRIVFSGSGDKVIEPATAGDVSLGKGNRVFKDIYLENAPIVSSDERLKQDFRSLKAAEKRAAIEIKESICLYKMRESVEEKGDGARWHIGVKAQQIVSIMEFHGLEPFDYGFICYDEWDSESESLDDDGNIDMPAREAGNKYAVRYDELAMFVLAAT